MSKRLSSLFNHLKSSSQNLSNQSSHNDTSDSVSVTSDYSGSVATYESPQTTEKRFFRSLGSSSNEFNDDIDTCIKNLYQDPDLLEVRCQLSIKGENYVDTNSSPSSPTFAQSIKSNAFMSDSVLTSNLIRKEYFTPDFDPIKDYINTVSSKWSNSAILSEELNEYFMYEILAVDVNKDIVASQLGKKIESNYHDLMACFSNVHEIDTDLEHALKQISDARRNIKNSSTKLMVGTIKISALDKRRERLTLLVDVVKSLKYIKDIYKAIQLNITTGDLGKAVEYVKYVLEGMKNGVFCKFQALKSIEDSSKKSLLTIRSKADKALVRICCRKFAVSEYSNIIRAYLTIDYLHEELQENITLPQTVDSETYDFLGCMDGLASRIQHYQINDIDNCLHTAILEFIYASHHKRQKAAAEIDIVGAYAGVNPTDMMDLAELPLNLLYQRINHDVIAASIMRCCELFTDSIYTHYSITKWHKSCLDQSNVNSSPDDSSHGRQSNLQINYNEYLFTDSEIKVLNLSYEKISSTKSLLWDDLLSGLIEMLNNVSITSSVSLDDFLAIAWAMECMIKLGEEFSNSNSTSLKVCIENKSIEYISHVHITTFQMFKQLVETDPWENVPIKISDHGGILGILKSKILVPINKNTLMKLIIRSEENGLNLKSNQDCVNLCGNDNMHAENTSHDHENNLIENTELTVTPSSSESNGNYLVSNNKNCSSIIWLLECKGNPFHFMTQYDDMESTIMNKNVDLNGEHNKLEFSRKRDVYDEISKKLSYIFYEQIEIHSDQNISIINSNQNSKSHNSKRNKSINDNFVVTQSILNGLARFTARYVQMMHLIPIVRHNLWKNLNELFNYYICYIFMNFLQNEEKNKFLVKPTKMSMLPPIQFMDYEALHEYLDAKLNTDINLSYTSSSNSSNLHNLNILADNSDSSIEVDSNSNHMSSASNANTVKLSSILKESMLGTDFDSPSPQSSNVNFNGLNNRIVAAESCWFVGRILSEIKDKLKVIFGAEYESVCASYISQSHLVTGQLRSLIYKAICPQLLKQSSVLNSIDSCSWDSKKLRDTHHEWVDKLICSCKEIWDFVTSNDGFADVSQLVREQLWMELCQTVFDIVLEGFSKIRKCSNEGRALMTMDIGSLHDGLDSIHPCHPPRGKDHINNYINATYKSEEDTLHWVEENWQIFSYKQISGLLTLNLSSVLNSKRLKDGLVFLDNLYISECSNMAQFNRYSFLFDQKQKDEGTISRFMRATIPSNKSS